MAIRAALGFVALAVPSVQEIMDVTYFLDMVNDTTMFRGQMGCEAEHQAIVEGLSFAVFTWGSDSDMEKGPDDRPARAQYDPATNVAKLNRDSPEHSQNADGTYSIGVIVSVFHEALHAAADTESGIEDVSLANKVAMAEATETEQGPGLLDGVVSRCMDDPL